MPNLDIPAAPETIMFRAVERVLKSDPVLSRVIKTWGTLNASQLDVESRIMNDPPTAGMMPMIRLFPSPEDTDKFATQRRTQSVFGVSVALYSKGIDGDDLLNLWGAVRSAIQQERPMIGDDGQPTTVDKYLKKAIRHLGPYGIKTPGYGSFRNREGEPLTYLTGTGKIVFLFMYEH